MNPAIALVEDGAEDALSQVSVRVYDAYTLP